MRSSPVIVLLLAFALLVPAGWALAHAELFDPWSQTEQQTRHHRRAPEMQQTGNVVLDWNSLLLDTLRVTREWPTTGSRALAIMHLAIHDAVNSIDPAYEFYLGPVEHAAQASPEAAVAAAGHAVLTALYPAHTGAFDAALGQSLGAIAPGTARDRGTSVGLAAAERLLAERADDGSTPTLDDPGIASQPGQWRPTFPAFAPGLHAHWGAVTPFGIESPAAFRPPGPPVLQGEAYLRDYKEVKQLGELFSSSRTPEQTEIAMFWADNPGTALPPGHWNRIAATVARNYDLDTARTAHLFALLNLALADAAIMSWEAKYHFYFWRPITAIRLGELDGIAATEGDDGWVSFLTTPRFPEYPSGHATFSGAAAVILTDVFGPVPFDNRSDDLPGNFGVPDVTRSFRNFEEAAVEAARSRIYGGIHFATADHDGVAAGQALADYVIQGHLRDIRPPGQSHWTLY